MFKLRIKSLVTTTIAAITATSVFSQEAEQRTSALEEIVVTVERRAQSLQDYAGTAQAFTPDDLARDGVGSEFRNLSFVVPGLNIANQEGNLEIFIRGVGSSNNTELGDPAVASHINGVYIPRPRGLGVQFYDLERVEVNKGPQGTLRGRNAVGGSVNIITAKPVLGEVDGYAQAEFGNFGQNAYQGALSVPIGETSAVRIAGFSEKHDSYFTNGGINQGLTPAGEEDETAGRISFLSEPNERLSIYAVADIVEEGGTGYPGAAVFDAFANEGLSFDDVNARDVVFRGTQGDLDSETWGVSTTITYDFDNFGVEYTGSYRELDFNQTNASNEDVTFAGRDVSSNAVNYDSFSTVYWQTVSESTTHEIRFFSNNDDSPLYWSAGYFNFDEDGQSGFFSLNDNGIFFSGVEFTIPEVKAESEAIYFDATYDISDTFRVKGGIRYTDESKFRSGVGGNWTLGLGSEDSNCCFSTRLGTEGFQPAFQNRPTFVAPSTNAEAAQFLLDGAINFGARDTLVAQLAGVVDGSSPNGTCIDRADINGGGSQTCPENGQHSFFVVGAPSQQVGDSEFDYTDWRLGFEWDIGDDSLLYATVSTGTKSGGFNDNVGGIAPTFDTEEVTAYEIGSKNAFLWNDNPVVANFSAFYYDYTDQVFQTLASTSTSVGDGFVLLNQNVADSEILGLEIETAIELPKGFQLAANFLFLDTEIKSGTLADVRGQDFGVNPNIANVDLSGNKLPLASDFTAVLKVRQDLEAFNGLVDWQFLANYRSSYHLSPFNHDPISRPAGSTICDGATDAILCGFAQEQDGYWTLNFNAGYTSAEGNWRAEFFINNIDDEVASQKAIIGNGLNQRFLNLPRTYGLRVRFDL